MNKLQTKNIAAESKERPYKRANRIPRKGSLSYVFAKVFPTFFVALSLIVPSVSFADSLSFDANITEGSSSDMSVQPSETPPANGANGTNDADGSNNPTSSNNLTSTNNPASADSDTPAASQYAVQPVAINADGEPAGAGSMTRAAAKYPAATPAQLASHVVQDTVNPNATTINLFNYDTGRRSGDVVMVNGSPVVIGNEDGTTTKGTDTIGTTGATTGLINNPAYYEQMNYDVWLGNDGNNINYGHLLTFGDGMRFLGVWNQGMTSGYGDIALERPGMQNIVDNKLATSGSAAGYPIINKTAASNLITTGYNGYPTVYQDAKYPADYWYGPWRNAPIYTYAGGKNVSNGTQQRAIAAHGAGSIGNLTDEELSLSYLFDPTQTNQGKKTYTVCSQALVDKKCIRISTLFAFKR